MKLELTLTLFAIIATHVQALHCTHENGCLTEEYQGPGEMPIMMKRKSMQEKEAFWAQEKMEGRIGTTPSTTGANCANGNAGGYKCDNVDMLSFVSLADLGCSGIGNDVWGWTDSNENEYVLAGCASGTSFVDVTDPTSPVVLGFLDAERGPSDWRDIKVFKGHAYIGSEKGGHGIQVMDLSQLTSASVMYRKRIHEPSTPVSANLGIEFDTVTVYKEIGSSHNVVINEASGFMYIVGGSQGMNCNGGLHMVDINTPSSPQFVGCFSSDGYTHDAECVIYSGPDTRYTGNEICFAYNEDTITIVDVTNKNSPQQLSKVSYSGVSYCHQGSLNLQQSYLMMDDEMDEKTNGDKTKSRVFDVTDLQNPTLKSTFVSTSKAIDHNQYIHNGYSYQANYCAGLRVLDVSTMWTADTIKEVAYFQVGSGTCKANFNGAWSNYPYFVSGNVALMTIEDGLFMLRPKLTTSPVAQPVASPVQAPTQDGLCEGPYPGYKNCNKIIKRYLKKGDFWFDKNEVEKSRCGLQLFFSEKNKPKCPVPEDCPVPIGCDSSVELIKGYIDSMSNLEATRCQITAYLKKNALCGVNQS